MDNLVLLNKIRSVKAYTYYIDGKPYFEYIKMSDVPTEIKEEFGGFMNGQTVTATPDGKDTAIYLCDWKNFLYKLETGKVLFWD
jgi:hypothetical protein